MSCCLSSAFLLYLSCRIAFESLCCTIVVMSRFSRQMLTFCQSASVACFSKEIVISNSRESRRNHRMSNRCRTGIRFYVFVNHWTLDCYVFWAAKIIVFALKKAWKTAQNSQSWLLIRIVLSCKTYCFSSQEVLS